MSLLWTRSLTRSLKPTASGCGFPLQICGTPSPPPTTGTVLVCRTRLDPRADHLVCLDKSHGLFSYTSCNPRAVQIEVSRHSFWLLLSVCRHVVLSIRWFSLPLLVQISVSSASTTGLGYWCNPYVLSSYSRPSLLLHDTPSTRINNSSLHDLTTRHTHTPRLAASIIWVTVVGGPR